jgi:hypothetical protein
MPITNDSPTAAGATNVLLNQRSLDAPWHRQAIGIQGDENAGKAIGFDDDGVLGAIPSGNGEINAAATFGLIAGDEDAAAANKTAWRAMMAYAAGRTQTTLVIPDGDYYLDCSFTGGLINVPSGTTIRMGKKTRIIVSIPTPLPLPDENSRKWIVFRIAGGSDILIEGGEIVGDNTTDLTRLTGYGTGVNIQTGCNNITVRDMVIRDCWLDDLLIQGGTNIRVENVECYGGNRHCGCITGGKKINIVGSVFSDPYEYMAFDMEIESPEDAEDVTFDRCIFSGAHYTGLAIVAGSSGKKAVRTKVLNCEFFGHSPRPAPTPPEEFPPAGSGLALNLTKAQDFTIENCVFHDNDPASDIISAGSCNGGLVTGCVIDGGNKGISFNNSQGISILGNVIRNTKDDAISSAATLAAFPTTNNRIGYNLIQDIGTPGASAYGRGIDVRGTASQVFNNRIERIQTIGIILNTAAQNVLCSGNKVSECGLASSPVSDAIYIVGTGHLVFGNDVKKCAVSQSATAQAGGASTVTLASSASVSNGDYVGYKITILSGTGSGQTGTITAYVGSTKVATVTPAWATPPDATSVYEVIPAGNCHRYGIFNASQNSTIYGNDTNLGGASTGLQESGTGTMGLPVGTTGTTLALSGALSASTLALASTTEATPGGAGALITQGGIFAWKKIIANTELRCNSTTDATTGGNGSVITAGGIYAAKQIIAGGELRAQVKMWVGDDLQVIAGGAPDLGKTGSRFRHGFFSQTVECNNLKTGLGVVWDVGALTAGTPGPVTSLIRANIGGVTYYLHAQTTL